MPSGISLRRDIDGPVTIGLAVLAALLAGASVAIAPQALAVLPFIALLLLPPVRSAQVVIALALLEGATLPFGRLLGLDPVYLAIWIVVAILCVTERKEGEKPNRLIITAAAVYAGCLLLTSFLHLGGTGLTHTLSLFNYLGFFLLTLLLLRRGVEQVVVPLLIALGVHEAIAAAELVRNSTWFYGEWKVLQATKVDGVTRIASTVADPNYFAVTLILLASASLTVARGTRHNHTAVALAAGAAVLLPFTFSRAGLIAVVVALTASAIRVRIATASKFVLRAGVALAVAALLIALVAPAVPGALLSRYAPGQRSDASVQSRAALQKLGLHDALSHPITGIGSGTFESNAQAHFDPTKPNNVQTDVLNTYLQAWLVGGIFTLAAFCVMLFVPTWQLMRRGLLLGFGLLGVAVALFTLNGLTLMSLWFVLAVAATITAKPDPAPAGVGEA